MTKQQVIFLLRQAKTIKEVNYLRYIWVRISDTDWEFNANIPKELK